MHSCGIFAPDDSYTYSGWKHFQLDHKRKFFNEIGFFFSFLLFFGASIDQLSFIHLLVMYWRRKLWNISEAQGWVHFFGLIFNAYLGDLGKWSLLVNLKYWGGSSLTGLTVCVAPVKTLIRQNFCKTFAYIKYFHKNCFLDHWSQILRNQFFHRAHSSNSV